MVDQSTIAPPQFTIEQDKDREEYIRLGPVNVTGTDTASATVLYDEDVGRSITLISCIIHNTTGGQSNTLTIELIPEGEVTPVIIGSIDVPSGQVTTFTGVLNLNPGDVLQAFANVAGGITVTWSGRRIP